MPQLAQRVTSSGVRLPRELLELWGVHEGQQLLIELDQACIRIFPAEVDSSEIADRAAAYVFDQVGDATAVGRPEREGDRWSVPVTLSYRAKILGALMYSARGELLPAESDSPATMRERAREA